MIPMKSYFTGIGWQKPPWFVEAVCQRNGGL